MVRHQYIRVNTAAGFPGIFGKPIQIAAIVFIGEKTGLAIIAALNEMDRDIGQCDAGATWHGGLPLQKGGVQFSKDQETVVCPLLFPQLES